MRALARRIQGLPTTVFSEFSALAAKYGAVNLGQGFPDFDGPPEIAEAAIRAIRDGINQYAVGAGAPVLREAVAEHSARFYGMKVDPLTMVTVTSGATEAIFDALLGLVDPGDEVVVFEPFYDSYMASIEMAGGVPRCVLLRPPDADHAAWWFDAAELAAQFSSRTKVVLVNTPHNPTGKVFTRAELEQVAQLCLTHDAVIIADEVYEHLVFPPAQHIRIATLPEMAERTLTLSSGGKSFSFTGWKIGWAIGPAELRQAVQQTHQFVTFGSAAPFQTAIAQALRLPDAYFEELRRSYGAKRDHLGVTLTRAGLKPHQAEGTYFTMAQTGHLGFPDDYALCRHLIEEIGVAAIPPSAFYSPERKSHAYGLARFAFCKRDDTLDEARKRLVTLAT